MEMMRFQMLRGFTLVELMITLAVLGILITIGVPSFNDLVQNQRVKAATSDIYSSLTLARSEAIKRNAEVNIVRNGSSWSNGWTVQTTDATPVPLKSQAAFTDITVSAASSESVIRYRRDGRLNTSAPNMPAPSVVVSLSGNSNVIARCIAVDPSGRANVKTDTNHDASDGCN
jgi:type IV fimbrial biogenesis protein FimT